MRRPGLLGNIMALHLTSTRGRGSAAVQYAVRGLELALTARK